MKPSEKEVLDTLRKTTLAYLSESDYVQIEKAVEQQGILNLTGVASTIVKSAVQKHGTHDQSTHGSWANGSGGASRSWEEMMSNPIEGEKYRRGGSSSSSAKQDNAKDKADLPGTKSKEQALSRSRNDKKVTEIATRLSALSDKMRTKTSNPYTSKENIASADKVKAISEKLTEAANPDISSRRHYELTTQAYASINKLSPAIFSNAGAGASFDSITMQTSNYLGKLDDDLYYMNKAVSVATGDMVSWNSSGGMATGKIVRIVRDGKINVPESSFTIQGTEDDPAALIQLYRDGKPTETKVGHKVSTLKKN